MKLNTLVVCLSTLGMCSGLTLSAPALDEAPAPCLLQSTARVPDSVRDAFSGRIEKDPRIRTYVTPARIVWQSENSDQSSVKTRRLCSRIPAADQPSTPESAL